MKRLVFASLVALIGLGAVLLVIRTVMAAPTNEDVAQRFNQKKKIYEQLLEMLIEDKEITVGGSNNDSRHGADASGG